MIHKKPGEQRVKSTTTAGRNVKKQKWSRGVWMWRFSVCWAEGGLEVHLYPQTQWSAARITDKLERKHRWELAAQSCLSGAKEGYWVKGRSQGQTWSSRSQGPLTGNRGPDGSQRQGLNDPRVERNTLRQEAQQRVWRGSFWVRSSTTNLSENTGQGYVDQVFTVCVVRGTHSCYFGLRRCSQNKRGIGMGGKDSGRSWVKEYKF